MNTTDSITKRIQFGLFFILILLSGSIWGLEEDQIPQHISILPVFFVPQGQPDPTPRQINMVVRHLEIAQECYKKMLKQRDTFSIADLEPQIVHDRFTLPKLKNLETKDSKKLNQYLISRLLEHFGINRFNCPYVFFVVMMSPEEQWPRANGRPMNPGLNSGSGIATLSSYKLDQTNPLFQGCLQHELGHAFGLVHIDSYGYDQHTNKSVMAFNKTNQWSGYEPPSEPAILMPEDIRGLSMNKRVFGNLFFDPAADVPDGYKLNSKLSRLGFDAYTPGQKPYEIKASSTCRQVNDTAPGNIVLGFIRSNRKSKTGIGLIPHHMWMSDKAHNGWVDIELEFPIAVRMNRIRVHSQCGGGLHPVKKIRTEVKTDNFKEIAVVENTTSDEVDICFNEVKSKYWRLHFKPDQTGQIVLRGLQFFNSDGEIFCPKFPTYLMHDKTWIKN